MLRFLQWFLSAGFKVCWWKWSVTVICCNWYAIPPVWKETTAAGPAVKRPGDAQWDDFSCLPSWVSHPMVGWWWWPQWGLAQTQKRPRLYYSQPHVPEPSAHLPLGKPVWCCLKTFFFLCHSTGWPHIMEEWLIFIHAQFLCDTIAVAQLRSTILSRQRRNCT